MAPRTPPAARRGDARTAKESAVAAHASQVEPLSPAAGDEVLLGPALLEHFERDDEILIVATSRCSTTPWTGSTASARTRGRWTPTTSGASVRVTLASLPLAAYERGLEVGCSVGALAVDLAGRCDALLAIDSSETAIEAARERTGDLDHVEVRRAEVPDEWPDGSFDLVCISEVGYFLSPAQLAGVVERSLGCLTEDGHLLLCHWRHQPVGWPLAGPAVHEAFLATGATVLVEHQEPDFLLHVLGRPA